MIIVRRVRDLNRHLKSIWGKRTVGFVPTMGDLHEGHLSLIRRSKRENQFAVVSIFVNPIQFDKKEDYEKYTRNIKEDARKAKKVGVDLLFVPAARDLYPAKFQTSVSVAPISDFLCGPFRPNHFQGVATVVLKLFNLVKPARAYFGMKDFQQLKVVEQMVRDMNLPVDIVSCSTVRDHDGLALSSRNRRLSSDERLRALRIQLALQSSADLVKSKSRLQKKDALHHFKTKLNLNGKDRLEYLEFSDPETLEPLKIIRLPVLIATAVWIGKTRLIDNLLLRK